VALLRQRHQHSRIAKSRATAFWFRLWQRSLLIQRERNDAVLTVLNGLLNRAVVMWPIVHHQSRIQALIQPIRSVELPVRPLDKPFLSVAETPYTYLNTALPSALKQKENFTNEPLNWPFDDSSPPAQSELNQEFGPVLQAIEANSTLQSPTLIDSMCEELSLHAPSNDSQFPFTGSADQLLEQFPNSYQTAYHTLSELVFHRVVPASMSNSMLSQCQVPGWYRQDENRLATQRAWLRWRQLCTTLQLELNKAVPMMEGRRKDLKRAVLTMWRGTFLSNIF
jgi:hypothetical protein